MRLGVHLGRVLSCLGIATVTACAQNPAPTQAPTQAPPRAEGQAEAQAEQTSPPDILVEIPKLNLDSLHLVVDSLDAHLYLHARIANLVHLTTRADITLDSLALDLSGLDAEALVAVRLDNLTQVLKQLLTTLMESPNLADKLLGTATPAGSGAPPPSGSGATTAQPPPRGSGSHR